MRDLRLIFFGDSLVNGTGDRDMLGWCGRLAAMTVAPDRDVTFYNLGVRHQTSTELLDRFRSELDVRLDGTFDKRAIVSIGFNDTIVENGCLRVGLAESRANLEAMIDATEGRCPLLVVGPPMSLDTEQASRIAALTEAYAEICGKRRIPFIPVQTFTAASRFWGKEAAANDGRHPRGGAYAELAAKIFADPLWTAFVS